MSEKVTVTVIAGVEGPCLAINDRRVAGPKPWGGGRVVAEWKIDKAALATIVTSPEPSTP